MSSRQMNKYLTYPCLQAYKIYATIASRKDKIIGGFMESNDEVKSIQSMGGIARAQKLSQEERTSIARKAAKEKWKLPKAIFGDPDKKLKIGDRELECYVLEDGTRVL